MTETDKTGRQSTRLEPETTWTVVTDSPLKGLSMAREAGTILAWDEGNQLYLYGVLGEPLSYSRVPNRIQAGAISDDGRLIALLVDCGGRRPLTPRCGFPRGSRAAGSIRRVIFNGRPARAIHRCRDSSGHAYI